MQEKIGRKNTYGGESMNYKKKIIELIEKIESEYILKKIYTFIKVWSEQR